MSCEECRGNSRVMRQIASLEDRFAEDESAAAATEAGADRILRKPISREELGACIRSLLDATG